MDTIKDNVKRILISEDERNHIKKIYEQVQTSDFQQRVDNFTKKYEEMVISSGRKQRYILNEILSILSAGLSEEQIKRLLTTLNQNETTKSQLTKIMNIKPKSVLEQPSQLYKKIQNLYNNLSKSSYSDTNQSDFMNYKLPKDAATEYQAQKNLDQQNLGQQKLVDTNKQLQNKLNNLVIRDEALKPLQKMLGVADDGVLGKNTWAAIKNAGLIDAMMLHIRGKANPTPDKFTSMKTPPVKTTATSQNLAPIPGK